MGIYNYATSPLPFPVNLRWWRKSADYTLDFLSCTRMPCQGRSDSKQIPLFRLERFLCFVFLCMHTGGRDTFKSALCLDGICFFVLPFWSLAPLPHRLRQQCKQLSSRTAELLSRSSSPSLWRGRQSEVTDAAVGRDPLLKVITLVSPFKTCMNVYFASETSPEQEEEAWRECCCGMP